MAQKDVPLADQHVWNTRGGFSRMLNDGVEWCSSCGLLKLSSGAAGRLAGHGQPGFLRPIPHDQPTFYPIDNWPFGPPCTRVRVRACPHQGCKVKFCVCDNHGGDAEAIRRMVRHLADHITPVTKGEPT